MRTSLLHPPSDQCSCSFFVQLHQGCGAATCLTPLCATARSHRSTPPLRSYTAVSARTMAVVLASSEDAHNRLCPNLPSQLPTITAAVQERVDHRSVMQQLFNSESLRNIHLIENVYSSGPLNSKPSIEISSSGPISCDDLIELCETAHNTRSAVFPSKQDDQLAHLYSRIRCLFSSFPSFAHSFSDNPMDILPGSTTSHSTTYCTKLHRALESVHAIDPEASAIVFDSIWEALEPVFESPFDSKHTESRTFQTFPSDSKGSQVPSVVNSAIHALTSFVPQASKETWLTVWSAIVNGKAYGKQKHSPAYHVGSPWLLVLDKFEQEPAMRMARRLVRAIGARTCLEETLSACGADDVNPDPRLQIWKTSCRIRESVINLLVQEEQSIRLATFKTRYRDDLRHGGELVGTTSLVWLEWLRKCFLKEWDGSLRINRWSVAGSALELIEDLCKSKGL